MNDLIEKAKKIKIIFFDIDDTLRRKSSAYMPDSIIEVFDKLRAKGIMTGIATGRNLYGVVPEIRALHPDFFVTINGAYVENKKHEVLYQQPFSTDLAKRVIDWLKREKSDYLFVGSHSVRISSWGKVAKEVVHDTYGTLPEELDYYKKHDVFQMVSLSEHDEHLAVPAELADEVRMVRWHPLSSDIVTTTGSKAKGCEEVLKHLGLKAENMMNFGDERNDLELFDFSGLSVAMGGSHPEVLKKANYITDTVENDGILRALQALKLIN